VARQLVLTHEFVEHLPPELKAGVLYVSIPFATAGHLCCCGCGEQVITPLSPAQWRLTFDGESVSLSPSIGNWGFPCQSHYWIRRNKVDWALRWSKREIDAVRVDDQQALEDHFQQPNSGDKRRKPSMRQKIKTIFLHGKAD